MEEEQQSIVAQWNEVMLEAIREGGAKPTATTYQLHLVSSAVYDAWAALDDAAEGYYSDIATTLANTEENKAEAVSFAAYDALVKLFPGAQDKFDAFMAENGYDPADASTDPDTAAGLGTLAARNVFSAREGDGSNFENDFADTSGYEPVNSAEPGSAGAPGGAEFDPNHWQPLRVPTGTVTDENGVPIIDNNDPDSFVDQIALTPHWGQVESFALEENDQFRPPAPPQLGDFSVYVDGAGNVTTGDQAYRDQVAEVIEFSAGLTNETKVIAEYWADGPRTESPPGHWNQIAQDIALREGHGIDEDAKLFFALNAALLDAGIATWEAKYTYDYVRPQSAIRDLFFDQTIEAWAGPNQGTQDILGQEWQPYQNVTFVTPPFPEYVSGHSTFSMAAANTIATFVGSDVFYDGTTLSNYDLDSVEGRDFVGRYETTELFFEDFGNGPPVVLQWETLTEAAEEAGISRLYGGIHIQDGNLNGLKVGQQVAEAAAPRWDALFTRGGDDLIEAAPEGGLLIAGSGADTVIGGGNADDIEGGSGHDVLLGGAGNDTIDGGDGDDVINTGIGFDLVEAGDGNDLVQGFNGFDTLNGGAGDDVLQGNFGSDELNGGDGDDVLLGGVGFDVLRGDAGNDLLVGREGFDTLEGGTGQDTLQGNAGNDVMSGGADNDLLIGGIGSDVMNGDAGNDLLEGQGGFDLLNGGDGDDRLEGNAGNDTLDGGAGNDVLRGGLGADTFVFRVGSGNDTVVDKGIVDSVALEADLLGGGSPDPADLGALSSLDADGFLLLDFGNGDTLTFTGITEIGAILDEVSFI
jgi:Ca2+-binding RTX toxin-like protein